MKLAILAFTVLIVLVCCLPVGARANRILSMKKETLGAVQGNSVDEYTLTNVHGLEVP